MSIKVDEETGKVSMQIRSGPICLGKMSNFELRLYHITKWIPKRYRRRYHDILQTEREIYGILDRS